MLVDNWSCLLIIVGRLLELIAGETVPVELKVEAVVILGSLAKGPEHVVHSVFDSGIMPLLLKGTLALLNIIFVCNLLLCGF